jgi:hypothetical protein
MAVPVSGTTRFFEIMNSYVEPWVKAQPYSGAAQPIARGVCTFLAIKVCAAVGCLYNLVNLVKDCSDGDFESAKKKIAPIILDGAIALVPYLSTCIAVAYAFIPKLPDHINQGLDSISGGVKDLNKGVTKAFKYAAEVIKHAKPAKV